MPRQQRGRQQFAVGPDPLNGLESELTTLGAMSIGNLKSMWKNHFGSDAPGVRSAHLLRRLLAWQLQANALGGFDSVTERKLREIATALERDGAYEPKTRRDLSPGVVLTREWKGAVHKVTTTADGFQYMGKRYGSLSDIARNITGTRWSGPRFFGLEQRKAPKKKAVAQ